jgi:hypothetical protein
MTAGELLAIFIGPLTAVIVSWALSARSDRSNTLERRVTALEVAQASMSAAVITRLDAIDKKLDAQALD